MRLNILDWLQSTGGAADHVVILTHNIDFLFLEAVLLPRLRALGEPALTIFADAASAASTYKMQAPLTWELGKRYRVVPVDLGPWRRFHPKAILVSGKSQAHLAIGSGNLTAGGWSGNYESWASYLTDGDGAPLLASFLGVIEQLPSLIALPEKVRDGLRMIATSPWVSDLPAPAGLLYSLDRPLLDQMAELLPGPASEVIVISPYFDPKLGALRQLAERFNAPVRVLAQPLRAGLSTSMAGSLPKSIRVTSAMPRAEADQSKFMHAKAYMIRTASSRFLFIGSANCSQAALTKYAANANAELMVAKSITDLEWQGFVEELQLSEEPPALPCDVSISDEPSDVLQLCVRAASSEGGTLRLAFSCTVPLGSWKLNDTIQPIRDIEVTKGEGELEFTLPRELRAVTLRGRAPNGAFVYSPEMWVDDEGTLGVSTPSRRMQRKLRDAASGTPWGATEYSEIFEIYSDNLMDDRSYIGVAGHERALQDKSGNYKLADIFADDFASTVAKASEHSASGYNDNDFLKTLLSLFGWSGDENASDVLGAEASNGEEKSDDDLREDELPETPPASQEQASVKAIERHRKKLLKTIDMIRKTLADEVFISTRPPSRLSADLGALGLLLRKAHSDGVLSDDDFSRATEGIWQAVFSGEGKANGSLLRHWDKLSGDKRESFQRGMQDPRLVASLTVWFYPSWAEAAQRRWFNLSIALICSKLPWLLRGPSLEEIVRDLARVSHRLLPQVKINAPMEVWLQWVRDGAALTHIAELFQDVSQRDLAQNRAGGTITAGDVLWQGGLCVALTSAGLHKDDYGLVRFLASGREMKVRGDYLYPVMDLLTDENRTLAQHVQKLVSA